MVKSLIGRLFSTAGKSAVQWTKGTGSYVHSLGENCRLATRGKVGERLLPGAFTNCLTKNTVFQLPGSKVKIADLEKAGLFKNNPTVYVGRSSSNHAVLTDAMVSRHHLQITKTGVNPPTYTAMDLGSTNGTFILEI